MSRDEDPDISAERDGYDVACTSLKGQVKAKLSLCLRTTP